MPAKRLLWAALLLTPVAHATERIVALTPDVAEVLVAIGAAPQVVGKERTVRDAALAHAQVVGFSRALTAEPVLKLKPTLVLGSAVAQPAGIYAKLRQTGLRAERVSQREDGTDFAQGIRKIGELAGHSASAQQVAQRFDSGMQPNTHSPKRVLLSYDGKLVAGRGTAGDTLIHAAGAVNAAAVDGFRPLNREEWLKAKPDLIVLAEHNRAVYGGLERFKAKPEIAQSGARVVEWPAAKFLRISLDSPAAARQLAELLR